MLLTYIKHQQELVQVIHPQVAGGLFAQLMQLCPLYTERKNHAYIYYCMKYSNYLLHLQVLICFPLDNGWLGVKHQFTLPFRQNESVFSLNVQRGFKKQERVFLIFFIYILTINVTAELKGLWYTDLLQHTIKNKWHDIDDMNAERSNEYEHIYTESASNYVCNFCLIWEQYHCYNHNYTRDSHSWRKYKISDPTHDFKAFQYPVTEHVCPCFHATGIPTLHQWMPTSLLAFCTPFPSSKSCHWPWTLPAWPARPCAPWSDSTGPCWGCSWSQGLQLCLMLCWHCPPPPLPRRPA